MGVGGVAWAQAPVLDEAAALARLVAAYPGPLCAVQAHAVRWCDGTVQPWEDGPGPADAPPDLRAPLAQPYPLAWPTLPPALGQDPGRARNPAFFHKMYGRSAAEVARHLVNVPWLPKSQPPGRAVSLRVTTVNGVHERLRAVSDELDALPAALKARVLPQVLRPAGGFMWRSVAGEARQSAHSWGIAVDMNTAWSDYWRWRDGPPRSGRTDDAPRWRNRIAPEVVAAFERQGFIWGGKWHHYDTMHFEYRPELLAPQTGPASALPR